MSEDIEYSFTVRGVSIAMDVESIKNDLMKQYNGIRKVTRLFRDNYDDDDVTPIASVQVDFVSSEDAERIDRERSIVIGGICRQTYTELRPVRERRFKPKQSYRNSQYKKTNWSEQDIVNMIQDQNKIFEDMLNAYDQKLNNAVSLLQSSTTQSS